MESRRPHFVKHNIGTLTSIDVYVICKLVRDNKYLYRQSGDSHTSSLRDKNKLVLPRGFTIQ